MTDSVKEMLTTDIKLKVELNQMFQKLVRKISIVMTLVSITIAVVIIASFLYVTRPTRIDKLVFDAIQRERDSLKIERQAFREEKWNILKAEGKKDGRFGEIDSHTKGHPLHKNDDKK